MKDILIYVPFLKRETFKEFDIEWVNNFKNILEVSLKQIVRQGFIITLFTPQSSAKTLKEQVNKSRIIISLLLDKDLPSEKYFPLNSTDQLAGKIAMQICCHPELTLGSENISDNVKSIQFYDDVTKNVINLLEDVNKLKNEIWLKFLDITFEIKKEIAKDKKQAISIEGKVFVAETSIDQNNNKENIIRELEHLGYEVCPRVRLPEDEKSFREIVSSSLQECFLSIHIIGNDYLPLSKDTLISSTELQNNLFVEFANKENKKEEKIKRLVWIPPNIKYKSEKQRLYVEGFKRDIELLKYTEIIEAPIEVFKTIIKNKYKKDKEIIAIDDDYKKDDKKWVYLISDDINSKTTTEAKNELLKKNLKVIESGEQINKIELLRAHHYGLINCDAILIIYSTGNKQWINSKLSDILKSPGLGRKKKYLVKSVLFNLPEKPIINAHVDDLDFINNSGVGIEKRLNPFIEKIT